MSERRLRILVIANLPPHVMGGAENQVARLVEHWAQRGHKVEVAGHRIPDGEEHFGQALVRTHRLRPWSIFGRVGRAAGYLASLAGLAIRRRRDFDVVYCRGIGDGAIGLVILSAAGLCRWPIVACPINARGAGDINFVRGIPGARWLFRLLDRHLAAINLINGDVEGELKDVGITRPVITRIPNGIRIRSPLMEPVPAAPRRLLWTGRLEHQKGLDLLVDALAEVRDRGLDFRLFLVGDGDLRDQLASQVAARSLTGHIRFARSVDADHVRRLFSGTDVFVLPSRYEGMSNSALEAMEAAIPVLCTRCGGIDAAVENGAGWVCPPGDLAALVSCIVEMLGTSDGGLRDRGRRARALVESRFDITRVADENLALLERVATH